MPDRRADERDRSDPPDRATAHAPAHRPHLHAHEKAGLVLTEQLTIDAAQASGAWIRSDYWERVEP